MPIVGIAVGVFLVGSAIEVCGFGLSSLAKALSMKRLVDRARKEVTVFTDAGQAVTISIDEFTDADGTVRVPTKLMDHADGCVYVLTQSESETLAKAEIIKKLVDSEVEMSNNGWKNVIRPLLKSIKKREGEIRRSPTRKGRRR